MEILGTTVTVDLVIRFVLLTLVGLYGFFAIILAFQVHSLDKMAHQVRSSATIMLVTFLNIAASLILLLAIILSL